MTTRNGKRSAAAQPRAVASRRQTSGAPTRGCIAIAPSDAVTRSLKTSETVARDVVRDIIANGMQPGDSLPTEAAMLELYGVSRESLREGLRLLEVQGLLTIRRGPGGGPVVGTVDPANLGRISTLYYHLSGATYRELFEAWVIAEALIAERAARNDDAAARLKAMGPYLEDPDSLRAPEELEAFVQSHTRFHAAIGSLVRNRVLELSLQTFGQIVSHHVAVTDDPRALRSLIESDHRNLAKAIIAGHGTRAKTLMEEHIRGIAKFNAAHLGTQADDFIVWQ